MYYAIRSNPKSTLMLNCETYTVKNCKLGDILSMIKQGESIVNIFAEDEIQNIANYDSLILSRYHERGMWNTMSYDAWYCYENNILPVYFETRLRLKKDYNYVSDNICFITEGDFVHVFYRDVYSRTLKTAIRALLIKGKRLYVAYMWDEEPVEFNHVHSTFWDYCTRNEFLRKVMFA